MNRRKNISQANGARQKTKQQSSKFPLQRQGFVRPAMAVLLPGKQTPAAPPVYRPQLVPKILQAKMAVTGQSQLIGKRQPPVAPPVYQPQSLPKVLQPKIAAGQQSRASQSPRQPIAPPAYRPNPTSKLLQPKASHNQPALDKTKTPGQQASLTLPHRTQPPGKVLQQRDDRALRPLLNQSRGGTVAPPVSRSQPPPNILQPKLALAPPVNRAAQLNRPVILRAGISAFPQSQRAVIQRARVALQVDVKELMRLIDIELKEAQSLKTWQGKGVTLTMPQESYNVSSDHKEEINEIGDKYGCHTCGTNLATDKDQPWIGDHIPPTELSNSVLQELGYQSDSSRVLYPQCDSCAEQQSALVRDLNSGRKSVSKLSDSEQNLLVSPSRMKPVPSSGPRVTQQEGEAIQALGVKYGCHSCKKKIPKERYFADHCPPKEFYTHYMQQVLAKLGYPQTTWEAKPQCPRCSCGQGGAMASLTKLAQEYAKEMNIISYKS